jgi:hypothetical protein
VSVYVTVRCNGREPDDRACAAERGLTVNTDRPLPDAHTPAGVRAEARNTSGWTTVLDGGTGGFGRDYCPRHRAQVGDRT